MVAGEQRRRASRRSVRWRLTFIATGIVGLVICFAGVVLDQTLHRMAMAQLRQGAVGAAQEVAATAMRKAPSGELPARVPGFYLLQLTDGRGHVVAWNPALRGRPAMSAVRPADEGRAVIEEVDVPGESDKVYLAAIRVDTPSGERVALAGTPVGDIEQARRGFALSAAVVISVVLALVGWIVWASVGRALAPFALMHRELAQITEGGLERRVSVPHTDDEVAELAESVNVTLDRLQHYVDVQRKFVADASHELRSPLTALRAQLEVALAHPDEEDWPAVAGAALGDADRLQKIVTDLLLLAKLDAGVRGERHPVDLGDLARSEAADRPRRVPVHVNVHDPEHPLVVNGNRSQLVRVLTNLLDNAERHARSQVRISIYQDGEQAVVAVADDGSGIPPKDRERVFQRFQRLPESRRRDAHGSGLGLPIARDVATAHGGTLTAGASDLGGALMTLRLPLRASGRSGPSPSRRSDPPSSAAGPRGRYRTP